jgi:RNA polymerase sigma factor (sigma-70 family)
VSAKPEPALDRHQLILDHMGMAKAISFHRMPYALYATGESEDAVQEAMLGLIQAANKFDPSRCGTDFQLYASRRIVGQLKDYLRHAPLVGTMRYDRFLRRSKASFETIDYRESSSPVGLAHFERLMRVVCRQCNPRTAAMIRLWCDDWTMSAIARAYGISKDGVRQRMCLAFKKARAHLR